MNSSKTLSNKLLLAKPLLKNGGIDQKGNHQQMSCENCMENQTQTTFLNLRFFMQNAKIIYFIPNALFEVFERHNCLTTQSRPVVWYIQSKFHFELTDFTRIHTV